MVDNLKPEDRIKTMRSVKGKGTRLEKRLCAMLAGMKIGGWRKNALDIEGKPDISFLDKKIAIFIDGCFWHGCPFCNRKLPQTNVEYWSRKIARNIELAEIHNQHLRSKGWTVIRIWEHELNNRDELPKIRYLLKELILKE